MLMSIFERNMPILRKEMNEVVMITKKKNAVFGRYPCCDMVNNAIRDILNGEQDSAIEELLQTIWKADGYLYEDLKDKVEEIHKRIWDERKKR